MDRTLIVLLVACCVAVVGFLVNYLWNYFKKEEEDCISPRNNHDYLKHNYGSTNNHDHLKVQHSTRGSAEAEVARMQRLGYEGSHRLNAYQGEGGHWYTGRGRFD